MDSEFLLKLTRVTSSGPRIAEIDALIADGRPSPTRIWFRDTLDATIFVAIEGELNNDGQVDAADLDIVHANWGRKTNPPHSSPGANTLAAVFFLPDNSTRTK